MLMRTSAAHGARNMPKIALRLIYLEAVMRFSLQVLHYFGNQNYTHNDSTFYSQNQIIALSEAN
jgi:hypothetical protein